MTYTNLSAIDFVFDKIVQPKLTNIESKQPFAAVRMAVSLSLNCSYNLYFQYHLLSAKYNIFANLKNNFFISVLYFLNSKKILYVENY